MKKLYVDKIRSAWKLIWKLSVFRYLLTGGCLFLIDLTIFLSLKRLGITTPVAQIISRSIGAAVGFVAHKFFSFGSKERTTSILVTQGRGYLICTIINLFISPVLITGFEMLIHSSLVLGKVVIELFMVLETYLILRLIFSRSVVTTRRPYYDC